MKSTIFRVDGSTTLGMGHVVRSMAFASHMKKTEIDSLFIVKTTESRTVDFIKRGGYNVVLMPTNITFEEEITFTRRTAEDIGARLLVTDIFHAEAMRNTSQLQSYHQTLLESLFVIVIAGGAEVALHGHIVIYPYYRLTYPSVPNDGRRYLLGPEYFIFGKEFVVAARRQRIISERVCRVLIVVGGADPLGLTLKAMLALLSLSLRDVMIRVIIGPAFNQDVICEARRISSRLMNCELVHCQLHIAQDFLWADLAIIGDGLVKYEAAITGTPSVMISRPESDAQINTEFAAAGSVFYVGDGVLVEVPRLASLIKEVMGHWALRVRMSQCGRKMVDGKGIERIMACIPSEILQ